MINFISKNKFNVIFNNKSLGLSLSSSLINNSLKSIKNIHNIKQFSQKTYKVSKLTENPKDTIFKNFNINTNNLRKNSNKRNKSINNKDERENSESSNLGSNNLALATRDSFTYRLENKKLDVLTGIKYNYFII